MGNYLSEPKTQKETVQGENQKMEFCGTGMQGWRMNMEDAHIAILDLEKDTHLFAVLDGHGGTEVSKFVAKHFPSALLASPLYQQGQYPEALKATFLHMDVMLRQPAHFKELMSYKHREGDHSQQGTEFDQESYAGCTSNVVLIKNSIIYCANAGDSRCAISHKQTLVKMSKDHKPDDPLEKSRITEAGGFVTEGRVNGNLNLSRALGDLEYKKDTGLSQDKQLISAVPDVKTRQMQGGDEFILMGCDGIWETETSEHVIAWIHDKLKTQSLKQVTEGLLDWLIAPDTSTGAGCDNMSAIIILLK